jgi:hypothetical protein
MVVLLIESSSLNHPNAEHSSADPDRDFTAKQSQCVGHVSLSHPGWAIKSQSRDTNINSRVGTMEPQHHGRAIPAAVSGVADLARSAMATAGARVREEFHCLQWRARRLTASHPK